MRSHRAIVTAAALFLPLASCSESTGPAQAATIEFDVAALSFAALGQQAVIAATVLDGNGNPMPTQFPTWSSSVTSVATVVGAGVVTAVGNGTTTITATRGEAEATLVVTVDQVPATLAYGSGINGNAISSPRGQSVRVPPTLRVFDANNQPIPAEVVTFTVQTGGGSIPVATAVTNSQGVARATSWTLGPDLGSNTAQATLGALTPLTFTVTGIDDPCDPAYAPTLALGATINTTLSILDCLRITEDPGPGPEMDTTFFDLYRIEVAVDSGVLIENYATHDAYLTLLASDNATVLKEVDDIVLGEITDSRLGIKVDAGTYFVQASSYAPNETGNYSLSARYAAVGVPTRAVANAGDGQVATPGATTAIAPSVLVVDEIDEPVAGADVTFSTITGVGSATGVDAVTGPDGIAAVGSWTLAAGANVLVATVAEPGFPGAPLVFSATGDTGNPYNIQLRFAAVPTASLIQKFNTAVARWEGIITADLPSQLFAEPAPNCPGAGPMNETIDDLVMFVRIEAIDGPGGGLASAGPCYGRPGSILPFLGTMRFDVADLEHSALVDVMLHEIGHVLGIGTIWSFKGLLINPSSDAQVNDTHFPGAQAIAAFNAAGGNVYVGAKVPVENTGGAGTVNGHWRETTLKNELMTGYIGGSNPLSAITIRSLQDLGYTVTTATADPYTYTPSIVAEGAPEAPTIKLVGDILTQPMRIYTPRPAPQKTPRGKPARQ